MRTCPWAALLLTAVTGVAGAAPATTPDYTHAYLPPWNLPAADGLDFTVAPFDNVADLQGDVVDPQLSLFFAGNQFMVVPDLIAAFKRSHPQVQRVFAETLPPGKLEAQIEQGSLRMGALRIAVQPDLLTGGGGAIARLQEQHHWFNARYDYAANSLAIMVHAGNPRHVQGLADLGRPEVRVSMPNPQFEGIARQIEDSYRKAGGPALDEAIMKTKLADGSTLLTEIHHRQSPLNILQGFADAAPVWASEAWFQQQMLHNPVETVSIPAEQNTTATYTAATLRTAPHPEAARAFLEFLGSAEAQAIYRRYGFDAPPAGHPIEPLT